MFAEDYCLQDSSEHIENITLRELQHPQHRTICSALYCSGVCYVYHNMTELFYLSFAFLLSSFSFNQQHKKFFKFR